MAPCSQCSLILFFNLYLQSLIIFNLSTDSEWFCPASRRRENKIKHNVVGILAITHTWHGGDEDAPRVINAASLAFSRRRHAIHNTDSTSSSSDDEQFQRRRNKNRSRSVNRWEWQFQLQYNLLPQGEWCSFPSYLYTVIITKKKKLKLYYC